MQGVHTCALRQVLVVITIKDIAKEANVSHSTVSRALRGNPAISEETAERIKKIAAELGYVPSAVARGLKTSRSHALGVIVNRIDDPFFSEILQAIEDVLYKTGYSLFVAASNRDIEREETIALAMRERRVDGLIVCTTPFGEAHSQLFKKYGFPVVAVSNHEIADYPQMIYHDDDYGVRQITQYLVDLGHKKIAFLGNGRAERTTQGRLNGFCTAMQVAELPVQDKYIFFGPNGQTDGGEQGARYFSKLYDPPTAIICFNDMMAIGLSKTLQDVGVRVPKDCSVVGFDNVPFSAYSYPSLTTFDQPKYQLGFEAANMMYKLLQAFPDSPSTEPQKLMLRGNLVIRESTGKPFTKR